jgi:aminoglycoside phosphotransferase (APT) family kinase protein
VGVTGEAGQAGDEASYQARIRRAFPELRWTTSRLLTHGCDHDVLLLDERLIFRFPKRHDYLSRFGAEVRLLAAAGSKLPLIVPQYAHLPPAWDFGGYPRLPGRELRPEHVAAMATDKRKRISAQLGQFLTALHGLPIEIATEAGFEPDYWWSQPNTANRYDLIRSTLEPHLDAAEIGWLDDQFAWYLSRRIPKRAVILHGDLAPDHLLFDPWQGELTGIIDFADVEIGDPAIDFAGLWDYGERFADEALESYRGLVDPELRERSRFMGRVAGAEIMYDILQGKTLPETFGDGRRRLQDAMAKSV